MMRLFFTPLNLYGEAEPEIGSLFNRKRRGKAQKGQGRRGKAQKGQGRRGKAQKGQAQRGKAQKGQAQRGKAQKGQAGRGMAQGGRQADPRGPAPRLRDQDPGRYEEEFDYEDEGSDYEDEGSDYEDEGSDYEDEGSDYEDEGSDYEDEDDYEDEELDFVDDELPYGVDPRDHAEEGSRYVAGLPSWSKGKQVLERVKKLRKWGTPTPLTPNVQLRARKGWRAAVVELEPGLFLVGEIQDHKTLPSGSGENQAELGALPVVLAPILLKAARTALSKGVERAVERRTSEPQDGGTSPGALVFQRLRNGAQERRERRQAEEALAQTPVARPLVIGARWASAAEPELGCAGARCSCQRRSA